MSDEADPPPESDAAAQRHARVSDIVATALELPESERAAQVHEACAGDGELESEVLSLLELDGEPELDPLAAAGLAADGETLSEELSLPGQVPASSGVPGYRLVRVLGEGGMGLVYEAEQLNPRRRVAIKVIRGFGGSAATLRRFSREADLLARLQHPGICQVHEVGRTESGAPYIAMELIEGSSLSKHAKEQGLDRLGRLALICRIAEAVAHAHERGIVHRDLKPENILVTTEGQPKIVDFGIARATEVTAGSTLLTSTGDVVGTISYMSPEQAAGERDVDHRTDIFSLGVICFELLSGRLPMTLEGLSLPQALHVIQQGDLSLAGRGVPTLRGDLETILGKALDRDPERRYQDAEAFAADIRRHLEHEPIVARPPSVAYRVAKFTRRHRVFVVAICFAFTALTLGAGLAIRSGQRATERAELAERQSYRAIMQAASTAIAAGRHGEALAELEEAPATPRGWEAQHLGALAREAFGRQVGDRPVTRVAFSPDSESLLSLSITEEGSELLRHSLADFGLVDRYPLEARPLLVPEGGLKLAVEGLFLQRGPAERIEFVDADSGRFLRVLNTCSILAEDLDTYHETLSLADDSSVAVYQPAQNAPEQTCELGSGRSVPASRQRGERPKLSPNGRLLLSHGNSDVWVRDRESDAILWSVSSDKDGASSVAFSSSSEFVFTAGMMSDPVLRKRSALTGKVLAEAPYDEGSPGREPWAFSADGSLLAIAAEADYLIVYDTELESERKRLALKGAGRMHLAFSAEGRYLAATGQDATGVRVWDLQAPSVQQALEGHENYVYALAFSPDGQRLASAGWDNCVRTWDVDSRTPLGRYTAEGMKHVQAVAWSPDGLRIFAASEDSIFVFDSEGRSVARRVTGMGRLEKLTLNTSRELLAGADAESVDVLDIESLQQVRSFQGAHRFAWSPDGDSLALARRGGVLEVRDAGDWSLRWSRPEGGGRIAWRRDGRQLATVHLGGFDLMRAKDGQLLNSFPHREGPWCMTWSPAGRRLVTGDTNGAVNFYSVDSGDLMLTLQPHSGYVKALAFSPDGRFLATASGDTDVRLWDSRAVSDRDGAGAD